MYGSHGLVKISRFQSRKHRIRECKKTKCQQCPLKAFPVSRHHVSFSITLSPASPRTAAASGLWQERNLVLAHVRAQSCDKGRSQVLEHPFATRKLVSSISVSEGSSDGREHLFLLSYGERRRRCGAEPGHQRRNKSRQT